MEKLTLLTFKELFNQLRYEDGEDFLNNEFKNRFGKKIFFYYNICDEVPNNFRIILANDKKEAIDKLLNDSKSNYVYSDIYKYRVGKFKCLICNFFFSVTDDNRLLREHFNSHSKEIIIDTLMNKEDLFIEIEIL